MASHSAGFAVAVSVASSTLQQVMHAAFRNGLLPTEYAGKIPLIFGPPGAEMKYSFFIDEPVVTLEPSVEQLVLAGVRMYGDLTFSSPSTPSVSCGVYIDMHVGMPVTVTQDQQHHTLQFGLDPKHAVVANCVVTRFSGPDPKPIYGYDLAKGLRAAISSQIQNKIPAKRLRFAPPMLDQLLALGLKLSGPAVKITPGSVNIGIDVVGKTAGNPSALVDLNRLKNAGGTWKNLVDKHVTDDEYGEPIFEPVWAYHHRTGAHNDSVAVSLSKTAFDLIYDKFGRYEIVRRIEDQRHDAMIRALGHLHGHHSYSLPELARVAIRSLEVILGGGYFYVAGDATYFGDTSTTVTFSLRLWPLYAVNNPASKDSWAVEVSNVHVAQPEAVTILELLGGGVGLILAPFTLGFSLVVAVFIDIVLSAIVDSLLRNAESSIALGITRGMEPISLAARFTLPDTTRPVLDVGLDDFAVHPESLDAWFGIETTHDFATSYIAWDDGATIDGDQDWNPADPKKMEIVFHEGGDLFSPNDPHVRIRWRVWAGKKKSKQILDQDRLAHATGSPDPKRIAIDHASKELDPYDAFVVQCRVYRPLGTETRELMKREFKISIVDVLNRHRPYIQWRHRVYYEDYSAKVGDAKRRLLGWTSEDRKSVIHRTDPVKRCRFATVQLKLVEYLDELPFPIAEINEHRNQVCPYCFFGGPEKHVLT